MVAHPDDEFEVSQEQDPWVRVPLWLLDRVSDNAVVVYARLAKYAGLPDGARPSIGQLAKDAKRSRSSVKRGLEELQDSGAVKVEGRWSDDGSVRLASRYTLRITEPQGGRSTGGPTPTGEGGRSTDEPGGRSTGGPGVGPQVDQELDIGSQIEDKQLSTSPAAPETRPDVEALCSLLADRIEANGSKRPTVSKAWRTECRLLLDKDGRTEQQIRNLIDWCQADQFWKSNILSMPTFRKQYDRMRLRARAEWEQTHGQADGPERKRVDLPPGGLSSSEQAAWHQARLAEKLGAL